MPLGEKNGGYEDDGPQRSAGFLSVNQQPAAYGNTYVYEPDKSLSRMTVEALPSEEHYRKLSSIHVDQRPTMEELMVGEKMHKIEEENEAGDMPKLSGKVVKFGWIEGVFMRCLLNIWGVMLFLRLTWVIGQAGLIQGLLVITLCNVVTGVTALSMSAVATNGQIASGGVYYMISRALGPEFGGAIGIMFTVANSISVATYTLGFCDNLFDLIYDLSDFQGIVADRENRLNDLRIIGTPVLILILVLAVIGMEWVTRVQKLLLLMLILAQIDMLVGTFLPKENAYASDEERHAKGFTGWSVDTAKDNVYDDYLIGDSGQREDFMSVFGVFFTAVTGIVAGANLSGDLKDPGLAIPKGTLLAIGFTYVTYIIFGIMVGFNFVKQASGNTEEYLNTSGVYPDIANCTDAANAERVRLNLTYTSCGFGSAHDQKVMTYISGTGYLVYLGCYGATLSSAIASLVGAPRVLQAVGKDKLYPKIDFFAKGNGANNDPFRGYILVFLIAFGCLMIGELNAIGKLASNFFLAAYALMNLSVFHSSMTKSPGWRPSFKFYNPWVSLAGCIVCIALMFLIDLILAISTIAAVAILYGFMVYLKPESNWGSSAEALVFLNALNNTHSLNELKDHVKTYRPKILLLSGNPAHRQPLLDFANLLTKKMSLLICAHIMPEKEQDTEAFKENIQAWLRDHGIKSFYAISHNDSFSQGVKNAISLAGLGKLSPNMVLMGYNSNKDDINNINEYFDSLLFSFEKKMAVGILKLPNGTDYSSQVGSEETIIENLNSNKGKESKRANIEAIYRGVDGKPLPKSVVDEIQQFNKSKREGVIDVWWLFDDGGLALLLPYILKTRKQFADCKLRVFSLSNRPEDFDENTRNLANLLAKFRIEFSEVLIIPDITKKAKPETKAEFEKLLAGYPLGSIQPSDIAANSERTNRHLRTAELLREKSMASELIILTLPLPRRGQCPPAMYMAWLDIMAKGLPPVLFTRGNQTSVLTYYS